MSIKRRRWNDRENGLLRFYWMSGKSPAQIAAELDRSICAIRIQASVLGITMRMPRPRDAGRKATTRAVRRNCLSCGEKFLSEWIGNRVCNACKETEIFTAHKCDVRSTRP